MTLASTDDVADALRDASVRAARVTTDAGAGRVPDATHLALDGLRAVVEFSPEDQTVTVEAGIDNATLAGVLAEKGQRLVLDAPGTWTVGEAIGTNAFGPRRHLYGTLKDLILGVTVVRVDGTVAHAGGKVVKNVAGFDLSKLMVGSRETLAVVTTATLRVHPRPEAVRGFTLSALRAADVWAFVVAMRERRLDPVAV